MNDTPHIPHAALGEVHSLRGRSQHRNPKRRSSTYLLQGRPAQMLLNRLDAATIVIGFDGIVVYANPACERMLGYQTALTLEGQRVNTLLVDQADTSARGCIELLRSANSVTNWNHSDGYPLAVLATDPVLFYSTALMLMVSLTDVRDRDHTAVDTANRFEP